MKLTGIVIKLTLSIGIFLGSLISNANPYADSLLLEYQNNSNWDKKASLAYSFAKLEFRTSPNKIKNIMQEVIAHKSSVTNTSMLCNAYNVLGIIYQAQHTYDSSNNVFEKGMKLAKSINDTIIIPKFILNMAINKRYLGNYEEAIKDYLNLLDFATKRNDEEGKGKLFTEIGNVFILSKQVDKGIKFQHKAILNFIKYGDNRGEGNSYHSLGVVYDNMKELDSAKKYYLKALEIKRQMQDNFGISATKAALCGLNYEINNNRLLCIKCRLEMVPFQEKIGDKLGLFDTYLNVGQMYLGLKNYQKALDNSLKAEEYLLEMGTLKQKVDLYSRLARCFYNTGNYKQASSYMIDHSEVYEDLIGINARRNIDEIEEKYQNEKKEQANQALLQQNQIKSLQMNRMWIGFFGITGLMLAILFFYRNRLKKRKLQLQEQEIEFKNTLLKSNMESEEKERQKIARELHDGIGQQISSIKLGVEGIGQDQKGNEQKLERLKAMVSNVMTNVRNLSHEMMPVALQRFGLQKAVESLVDFINPNSAKSFSFESYNLKGVSIDKNVEIQLYRITQELIQNINKHSEATEATIQLFKQKNKLNLVVSDNGKGMPIQKKNLGMGLLNVHARVNAISGVLSIESGNGETVFHVVVGLG